MSKANTRKSYAEEGLEGVQAEASAAEALLPIDTGGGNDEGELQQIGGLEPVTFYYRTSAPKKPTKSSYRVISKGDTINGQYIKSFISGKYKNTTYLVRQESGELVGLPNAGSLNKAMAKLAEGSKVKITYNGMEAIKGGEWAGSDAHSFTVFGNKLKA